MIHDETTTEIELPGHKKGSRSSKVYKLERRKPVATKATASSLILPHWLTDFDLEAPWVLRLIAVIGILILSMLVL